MIIRIPELSAKDVHRGNLILSISLNYPSPITMASRRPPLVLIHTSFGIHNLPGRQHKG